MLINLWSFHRFYFFKEKWVWSFPHRIHILRRLIQVNAGKIQTVQNGTELKVSPFPCFQPLFSHHHFLKMTTATIILIFSFSYFSQIFKLKNICIYMCVYTINTIQHVAILLYKIYSWPLDSVGVGAPTLHEEENLPIIYSQLSSRWSLHIWGSRSLDSSGFPGGSVVNNPPASAGDVGSIPGSGRSPGEGNSNHSTILAWEIPWIEEPGRL